MKKVSILLLIATVTGMGACTSSSWKSGLKTDLDSMSYHYGFSRAEGLMDYLAMQAGVDTSYMDAFFKGYKDGAKHYGPKEIAYQEGKRIALMINNQWVDNLNQEIFMSDSGFTVNRQAMLSGFYQGVKNRDNMKSMQADTYSQIKMNMIKNDHLLMKHADYIASNEAFLAGNKSKEGVVTTSSGLQYKIITEGAGTIPDERAKIKVNYRGTFVDGTEFDSSYKNDVPSTFRVNQVIKGWTEALTKMPVGSKWMLYVPQDLAYGTTGNYDIPPFSTLIFEIELLEIEAE